MHFTQPNHVENRRLFAAAAGTDKLEVWERRHLHACEICQGVFYVFVRQLTGGTSSLPPTGNPPAA
jgi:hypothetical protein